MKVTIKLFAFLQDQLGPEVTIELDQPTTVNNIFNTIVELDPTLKTVLTNSRLAINQEFFSGEELSLKPTDEVAIIPPVSGG